jgi:hypothetical protein
MKRRHQAAARPSATAAHAPGARLESARRAARALTVIALAGLALGATAVHAQPQDGRPDFSGVWFPAGHSKSPTPRPLTDEARAMVEQYQQDFVPGDDPGRFCIWPGLPRTLYGPPFAIEIIHRAQDVTIYWEGYGMYRKVYMADRNPPEPMLPSSMGHSLAHWDGDALVIETTHLKPYPYWTEEQLPTSSEARVVERMTLEEREENGQRRKLIVNEVTVHDPKVYTEPVHIRAQLAHQPGMHILEYTCSDMLWEEYLESRDLAPPDIDALPMPGSS